jgi:hypothetical protein
VSAGSQSVQQGDYIFDRQDFDSSPIVLESHKLVFFTVAGAGDVTWRCLFRRMMGYRNWQNTSRQFEDLRYLYDFNAHEATNIMNSPEYTRAMFVRDPKERLVSAYLEKVMADKGEYIGRACCAGKKDCVKAAMNFTNFVYIAKVCDQPFWRPQGRKMEPRFYQLLNFVGHYEHAQQDAKQLLQRIGAWDEYGRNGWGSGDQSIFHDAQVMSQNMVQDYFSPELERKADAIYDVDYGNPVLSFRRSVTS